MAKATRGIGRWLTPLLAGLLAAAALVWWHGHSTAPIELVEPVSRKAQGRSAVYFGPSQSVAVMPFQVADLKPAEAFWSVGLPVELTRLLTRSPGMQVTSANSTLFFRDREVSLRIAAERLRVTWLLSGRVRPGSGDGVLQLELSLYNARRDRETWSESFELEHGRMRQEIDIVVASVAESVRVGKSRMPPPAEPFVEEAWVAYLQGLYLREGRDLAGNREAERRFRQAVVIDPGYEPARLGLISSWLVLAYQSDEAPGVEDARTELNRMLQANPRQSGALGLSSYISRNHDWDWQAALRAAELAVESNPGDPELKTRASLALFSLGRFSRARALKSEAVAQDPLNLSGRLRLGLMQEFAGEHEAALATYDQLLALNSEFPAVRALRARVEIIRQNPDLALQGIEQEVDPFWQRYARLLALTAQGEHAVARPQLEQMKQQDADHAAYQIAEILAYGGDLDGAFEWLGKAIDQHDGGIKELLGNYFLNSLHDDPRWAELLARLGFPLDLDY